MRDAYIQPLEDIRTGHASGHDARQTLINIFAGYRKDAPNPLPESDYQADMAAVSVALCTYTFRAVSTGKNDDDLEIWRDAIEKVRDLAAFPLGKLLPIPHKDDVALERRRRNFAQYGVYQALADCFGILIKYRDDKTGQYYDTDLAGTIDLKWNKEPDALANRDGLKAVYPQMLRRTFYSVHQQEHSKEFVHDFDFARYLENAALEADHAEWAGRFRAIRILYGLREEVERTYDLNPGHYGDVTALLVKMAPPPELEELVQLDRPMSIFDALALEVSEQLGPPMSLPDRPADLSGESDLHPVRVPSRSAPAPAADVAPVSDPAPQAPKKRKSPQQPKAEQGKLDL